MTNITDNIDLQRFELSAEDGAVAAVYYRIEDNVTVLTHTEVPFEHSGEGMGTRLAIGTFALLRRSGRHALVRCDFMGRFIAQHPEFSDVLAH